ncbi:MAG TPA: Calx-beta domain-containing protein [Pyrinomonadaceae bacterium]|nr:Calx-beta domain-containing protein [Pyrinomonadaceae bacterium]
MRMKRNQKNRSLVTAALALAFICLTSASALAADPNLIISEFRVRGPNGANDEFVEIYNNSDEPHTVLSGGGSLGYALVASDGVKRFVIPNGTVIPARGHYLGVNSVGYSLSSYPAGTGTTAVGDVTYTIDIPDNAGIALFKTSKVANFTLANRLDAVGSNVEVNALYREGAGYLNLTPFSIDYSFYRDNRYGHPKDTNDNAADFLFVDSNGTSAGAGQRLGAPGPENLSSPIRLGGGDVISRTDATKCANCTPNRVRNYTSDPAHNSTFGTIAFRRKFTNQSGGPITRLRVRVVDLQTFPSPAGYADLRPRTSEPVTVTLSNGGNVTAKGTTLEQPPSQPNGGAFNSSLSVETVAPATPLINGASLHFHLLLGIQQPGNYSMAIVVETLPASGSAVYLLSGDTEAGGSAVPVVDLDGNGGPTHYYSYFTEGGAPVNLVNTNLATVSDADSATLKSARAKLLQKPDGAAEVMAADTSGTNITAAYNPATGELTLNGPDTVANFQKVLRTVTYANASPEPNTMARTVEFTANDGNVTGQAAEGYLTVKGNNDAPVNATPGLQTTNINVPVVFSAANGNAVAIGDADAAASPVKVTLTASHGSITLNGTAGLNFTVGDGTNDATVSFTGTLAAINNRFNGMSFKPAQDYVGAASVQVVVDDLGNVGEGGAKTDTDTIAVNVVKAGVLQFAAASYKPGAEGAVATITVKRTNGTNGTVKVDYATMNDTALAGQDYTAKSGTLTFLQGETSKTFTVASTNDTKVEADETFKVRLSNPTNGATVGALDTSVVTIEDNDVPGASVNDVTVTEGNSGTRNATFTVTLDEAPQAAVTVNFTTQNQSAIAGHDYVATSGKLTFNTGQKSKTVTVTVNGDAADEAEETFLLKLLAPVGATIVDSQGTGKILDDDAGANAAAREAASVQFASPAYSTAEGTRSVTVEVTREGDVSKAASVRYSSDGLGSLVGCDVVGGVATPRCDYSTDLGVLRFAPGEKTRGFTVAIIDDAYADGMETTQLRLSDAVGMSLGAQSQAQLTIEDNDADSQAGANPVESREGFVRQQYLDLLGREPEPEGERYWLGLMNNCRACDRAEVSSRFFRSQEFEGRGYFVYRFYEAGLGRLPALAEFMPDLAGVSGPLGEAELEASKQEFVLSFASRPEFEDRYGALTDPAAYVDALLQTAGLPNHPGRAAWTEALANGTATRAGVLRALVESAEVYEKFYNRGFVVMQYFGHLRRDPDGSYLQWLDVMNEAKGDTRPVIEGFLKSSEYRARFGKQQ